MNLACMEGRKRSLGALIFIGIVLLSLGFQACQSEEASNQNQQLSGGESTPTSFAAFEDTPTQTNENNEEGETLPEYNPVWGSFLPPSIDPATPIPPPLTDLDLSDEILVWVLLGSDTEPPFTGRMQAIHLLFIHPRFSKASLVSIPGDLYVYIPGYTMQRLNTAYAIGGIETLRQTFAYNFGVKPSRFVLAHPGDFQWLVDDLNGIEVTVFYPIPNFCGGIPAGRITMDGALALCYVSFREGMDEVDRMRRQQQLLRLIFLELAWDGNLVNLPLLYASYEGWVKTDLSLSELMEYIPLALRLADPDRISYYLIGWDQITQWEVPDHSQAQVFLPDRAGVKAILQQAIDDVLVPSPLTDQVQTLAAQLTAANIASPTPAATITPTPSRTPTVTPTFDGTPPSGTRTATPIPTATVPGYP